MLLVSDKFILTAGETVKRHTPFELAKVTNLDGSSAILQGSPDGISYVNIHRLAGKQTIDALAITHPYLRLYANQGQQVYVVFTTHDPTPTAHPASGVSMPALTATQAQQLASLSQVFTQLSQLQEQLALLDRPSVAPSQLVEQVINQLTPVMAAHEQKLTTQLTNALDASALAQLVNPLLAEVQGRLTALEDRPATQTDTPNLVLDLVDLSELFNRTLSGDAR